MARRKKRKTEATEPAKKPPPAVKTRLGALLADVDLSKKPEPEPPPPAKPAPVAPTATAVTPVAPPPMPTPSSVVRPSSTLRGDDRIAFYDAIAGVKPLGAKAAKRVKHDLPPPRLVATAPGDEEARARLAALVAGSVRFEMERDGDEVAAIRAGAPKTVLRALRKIGVVPEATLDLHGCHADDAARKVVRFARDQQRRGVARVCIVHGKGNHSEHGISVLRDVVIHALTEGGAAPVVLALCTAPLALGGTGALLVELERG